MKNHEAYKAVKPDPRAYVFQLMIVVFITGFLNSIYHMLILFILMIGMMIFNNLREPAKKYSVIYCLLFISSILLTYISTSMILMIFSLFIIFTLRIFPIYMAYVILIRKVQIDELITGFEQMHIPRMLIIPLVIFYRFIPTISMEIKYICESLKMRGINTSFLGIVKNPIQATENILVPLLIRSGKITDEISAASLCRGLSMTQKRTCVSNVKFDKYDIFYCLGCVLVLVLFFLFK